MGAGGRRSFPAPSPTVQDGTPPSRRRRVRVLLLAETAIYFRHGLASHFRLGRALPKRMREGPERLTFYREVPVDDVRLLLRRFMLTNLAWRCPACGSGRVSYGLLSVRDSCESCGSRFRRLEGNELISIPLSFFLASAVTFLVGLLLVQRFGFFPGITWALLAVGLATVLLGLKPMKVLALWLLWVIGFVYRDGLARGKTTLTVDEALSSRPGTGNRSR